MCIQTASIFFQRLPVKLERRREKKRSLRRTVKNRNKKRKTVASKRKSSYRRLNIENFCDEQRELLGPYLTELIKMKLYQSKRKKPLYSPEQKFIAMNLMVASSGFGYNLLKRMLPLPCARTVKRELHKFKLQPGITIKNSNFMRLKMNIKHKNKFTFLLIDEVSLRSGLSYHQPSDTVYGFEDNGRERSKELVTSALCVMAVGVLEKWSYPLGFYLTSKGTKAPFIVDAIKESISAVEQQGFTVLGITSDQGSNFERAFKLLGATECSPKISIDSRSYFVHRDPPHLLKSARNYLLNGNVRVPGFEEAASWSHIQDMYSIDVKNSMRLVPKLSQKHLLDIKHAGKMKVKLATQVLSNSVSAAIDFSVAKNLLPPAASATSTYLKKFNDLFDILNSSSSKDKNPLKRPLHLQSPSIDILKDSLVWLNDLEKANLTRKCQFIRGWRHSIAASLELNIALASLNFPYLSTRNICQDGIELFFGKVRQLAKFPDAFSFSNNFASICSASLVCAPLTGNCEEESVNEKINDTLSCVSMVSLISCMMSFS